VALVWTLHPLQTERVTYMCNARNRFVGLCYLLTLWCFIRAPSRAPAVRWKWLASQPASPAMLSKEYGDRADYVVLPTTACFSQASLADAWTQRGRLHWSRATWVVLAALCSSLATAGATAGLGTIVSPVDYALTQVGVVVHYLRLRSGRAVVFDYGNFSKHPGRRAAAGPAACAARRRQSRRLWRGGLGFAAHFS